ncbi:MAG: ATP-binding protein [Candidatus Bathyarchaeia archaeon]|nr:adenine nucleotide alpha hydrolase family protein [Candidatus Bathyarchaeota archaeon]
MKCKKCGANDAEVYLAYSNLKLCPECFMLLAERKVRNTIETYKMLSKNDNIGIAVSGGKDSATLAYILSRSFEKIPMTLIYIDLGIPDYSQHCLEKVKELSKIIDRDLIVYSLEKELGFRIPDFKSTIYGRKMCSACGTVKRYLFNKITYDLGLTKIATGHNLDDTVEAIFNSYMEGNVGALVRLKPVLPKTHPKMMPKIKPLICLTDMECLLYATYRNLPIRMLECQFAKRSRTIRRKEVLNLLADKIPSFKHTFISSHYRRILPLLEKALGGQSVGDEMGIFDCPVCGMPTSLRSMPCHFCKIVSLLKRKA